MFEDVHSSMIPLAFFYLLIIPIGVFSNILMIVCFFVNPRLRTPFHILLTLTCLADAVHVCGQIVFVIQLLSDSYSTQSTCFILNFLPVAGLIMAAPLLLQIGLDRLLAVSFPHRYRELLLRKFRYTAAHLIFPILFTSFILYLGFEERNNEQVKCAIPTALSGVSFKVFTLFSHVIYVSILLAYLMTAVLLKMHNASSRFKAVFKSIGVTVGIVLFGWAITSVSNTFGYYVTSDPEIFNVIQMYSGITVNIAISSNLLVFYTINPEYRLTVQMLMDGSIRKQSMPTDSGSELNQLRKTAKSQDS
uniref:G_PROTEIN_RECEP_F1_2 domain-containing protein n=1 Tax=Caenorhabditis japonica TaxID=281687 RepID=A0A8R1EAJ8_CAEJA